MKRITRLVDAETQEAAARFLPPHQLAHLTAGGGIVHQLQRDTVLAVGTQRRAIQVRDPGQPFRMVIRGESTGDGWRIHGYPGSRVRRQRGTLRDRGTQRCSSRNVEEVSPIGDPLPARSAIGEIDGCE